MREAHLLGRNEKSFVEYIDLFVGKELHEGEKLTSARDVRPPRGSHGRALDLRVR